MLAVSRKLASVVSKNEKVSSALKRGKMKTKKKKMFFMDNNVS
jgi:hypothetical protein